MASPEVLRLGQRFAEEFHRAYSSRQSNAAAKTEATCVRSAGNASWSSDAPRPVRIVGRGRIDLLIEWQEASGKTAYVVAELKRTDWDSCAENRVVPNLYRHRRQVWGYIEPLVEGFDAGEIGGIQAVLIYPRRPRSQHLAEKVESYLEEWGIVPMYAEELVSADARASDASNDGRSRFPQ